MFKARHRSILALFLAFVTAFLVSCGSPTPTKPLTYTPTQIQQIQQYVSGVEQLSNRLPELAKLIQDENWTFVKNFIRGPLGELRTRIGLVERNLLPQDRAKARETSKELFESLISIDQAADKGDYKAAISNYGAVIRQLNAFFELARKS